MRSRLLILIRTVAGALAAASVLAACSSPAGDPPSKLVDAAEARRLVESGIKVVDVRTAAEFAAGHLPGAINIPYDELGKRHAEVGPPSTPVLLYCRTGRRSAVAAETLRQKGFSTLYDLQAYDRWVAAQRR